MQFSPHTFSSNIADKAYRYASKDAQGKGRCAPYRIQHLHEEHGASSRKLSLLDSLPSSHVDESQSTGWYTRPVSNFKLNMQFQIPHLFCWLCASRWHIKWIQNNDEINSVNLFPANKNMCSMIISTLPWSQGLQKFMLTMLTQAIVRKRTKVGDGVSYK
jgi:hypothetical protein